MSTKTNTKEAARAYHRLGANVLPIVRNEKNPSVKEWKEWQGTRQSEEWVEAQRWDGSISVVCGFGGFSCIDFDGHKVAGSEDQKYPVGEAAVRTLVEKLGLGFDTYAWVVRTSSGGYHVWVDATEETKPRSFQKEETNDMFSDTLHHIEWRSGGAGYAIVPPSTGKQGAYSFVNGEPTEAPKRVPYEVLAAALGSVLKPGTRLPAKANGDSYQIGTNETENRRFCGDLVGYLCEKLKTTTISEPRKNSRGEWEVRLGEKEGHGGFHVLLRDRDNLSSGYAWNCFRDDTSSDGEHLGGGAIGGGWPDGVAYMEYGLLYKKGTPLSTLTDTQRRNVGAEVKKRTGYTVKELYAIEKNEPSPTPTVDDSGAVVRIREGKNTYPEYVREWMSVRGLRLRYNELRYRVEYNLGTGASDGERWDPVDNAGLCEWSSDFEDYTRKRLDSIVKYITAEARKNRFDPVRDYFDNLPKWDGVTNHIGELAGFLRMDDPERWEKNLTKWMMGAYKCGYYTAGHGGYKNELFLILHGGQGVGKTHFVENLIPKKLHAYMYTGTVDDKGPARKDSLLTMSQCWILNHEELESLRKVEQTHLKQLLSAKEHEVRPPYGSVNEIRPRRVSFIGSTNEDTFLTDRTGSRRMLIHSVVERMTDEDRDRLPLFDVSLAWAQAKAYSEVEAYGWKNYLNQDEEKENAEYNQRWEYESPEEIILKRYIDRADYGTNKEYMSATEVTAKLYEIMSEADSRTLNRDNLHVRVGRALTKLIGPAKKVRIGSATAWKYHVGFTTPEIRRIMGLDDDTAPKF